MTKDLYVLEGARTAMAEYSGTPGFGLFKDITAIDLCAAAAKEALARAGADPSSIDHVIVGNALQTSKDAIYGARHVGLKAGVPETTPALTVNRLCGSGLQSIVSGSQQILLGEAETVLAAGMENMSQAPHVVRGARTGLKFTQQIDFEDLLAVSLFDPYCGCSMAGTAENLVKRFGITREEQDEFAYRSHTLGTQAVREGTFGAEIVPVTVKKGRKEIEVKTDDHIKPDTSLEALAKLRSAFGKEGSVTAGNASGIVDGAAAVVVSAHAGNGKKPIGKVIAWGIAGVKPSEMGIGPAVAIPKALERAGLKLDDVDLFEINEAFAGQYLAVEKDLGLDRDKVNVNGGAIALGHPLAATGTRLALTLLYTLRSRKKKIGVASACIGGGQGIAVVFESVA
ncbi:MAG: thiolase family protein [Planctomycetota bacterium]|nr:thiolase family protein [Planctomycetota bacterium]